MLHVVTILSISVLMGCTFDGLFSNFEIESSLPTEYEQASREDNGSSFAYCNQFNSNEFSGALVAYFDQEKQAFNKNKAFLILWSLPDVLIHPNTNYFQIHSFSVENNREIYNNTPVTINVISEEKSHVLNATAIGDKVLDQLGFISVPELIATHKFVLNDLKGWQGVDLSIFNNKNKPEKTIKLLIPPFENNPHTYSSQNGQEEKLSALHPFAEIASRENRDRIFYDKAKDVCEDLPNVQIDIPSFQEVNAESSADRFKNESLLFLSTF